MSTLLRLASGHAISKATLLATSSYLITNWTRTADMTSADEWLAVEPERGMRQDHVQSVALGTGGWYGNYAGELEFLVLTPLMRGYIEGTLLANVGIGLVTVYMSNARDTSQLSAFRAVMVSPFANGNDAYERWDDNRYWNVRYTINRGVVLT